MPLEFRVEAILNGIISSSMENLSYFTPSVSYLAVHLKYNSVFFLAPFFFFDIGIQVIVPSLSTLFPYSSRKGLSYGRPVSRAVLYNLLPQDLIFFLSPGSLACERRAFQFKPSIETLYLWSVTHTLAHFIPSLFSELFNKLG